jgi:hypothetical protein
MSGPKRTLLARQRKDPITPEMVELFRRGREIQKAGATETWEEEGGRRGEFLDITKRLDWSLLHRVGQCSVFDDFSGEEPDYMASRSSTGHPDICGWHSGRAMQQRLQAALDGTRPMRASPRAS